ncbi:SpoIIE family protein phosphatase [Thermoleophilia bacterium SCSIO 60948]|nr:SpoIIE family protein phosphatase [Thermoleophilia bacterium SCSIO 60948]
MKTARTASVRTQPNQAPRATATTRGLLAGILVAATILALDFVLAGMSATITGAFVLAPFAAAVYADARRTAIVALIATALAAASFLWHGGVADPGHGVRTAVVFIGSGFAVFAAAARTRAATRSRRLEILDAFGDIAISTDTGAVLDRIEAMLVPEVADLCLLDVVEPDGGVSRLAELGSASRGDGASLPSAWLGPFSRGGAEVAPRPVVLTRTDREDSPTEVGSELARAGIASAMAAPLTIRGETRGSLLLGRVPGRARFSAGDAGFASALAGRVALVLENSGLSRELTGVEARLRSVVSLIDDAVLISDPGGRIVFVNAAAESLFGLDGEAEMLGVSREELLGELRTRTESGDSIETDRLFSPEAGEMAARLSLPNRAEVWARVRTRRIAGESGEPDHLLTTIGDQSDVRRAAFAQSLLARTGGLLVHSSEYRKTLDDVARLVVGEFADHCSINLPGEGGVIEQVAVANTQQHRRAAAIQLRERYPVRAGDDDPIARCLASGEPLLLPRSAEMTEQRARDETERSLMREVGHGSSLIVPMRSGERMIGVMAFTNREGGRAFSEFDLEIAVALGLRAGEAIDNARLATERARVAEILQRELLPARLPVIDGWATASMYRPAGEVNQVGGDFYDAFEVDGGWAVILGDVVGRGANAASLTAEARHTLRTALTLSADPEQALEILDAGFRRRSGARLCSVAIAILGGPSSPGEVRVWSAGHPLPLLVRGGTAFEVGEPGPLLGIELEPSWPETSLELEPGDQLVIYTDGVIEARGESERFGIGRMRATVASASEPAEAIAAVEAALRRFLPDELEDDAAMVVLRRSTGRAQGVRSRGPSRRAGG